MKSASSDPQSTTSTSAHHQQRQQHPPITTHQPGASSATSQPTPTAAPVERRPLLTHITSHPDMADEDAEIAFLRQMQAEQESEAWDNGTNGITGDGQPDNTESSDQQAEAIKEKSFADESLGVSNFSRSPLATVPHDAASLSFPAMASNNELATSRPSPPRTTAGKKSRNAGGFLDDSDDDEDNTAAPKETSARPLQFSGRGEDPALSTSRPSAQVPGEEDMLAQAVTTAVSVETSNPQAPGETSDQNAQAAPSQNVTTDTTSPATISNTSQKARLPHDTAGILQDRIDADPRGDIDAWLSLIREHRKRNKLDEARAVYERFFKVFPSAADIWQEYLEMELSNDNFYEAEQIFGRCLLQTPHVGLWSVYINYIRRRNDLTNDTSGTARATITQAYDFVLQNVGLDKDSGRLWYDYIQFIRSAPGQIGGSSWQDQQKMDQLRKAYNRATRVPMASIQQLWKEYDQFEMSLNKTTGRKFMQERSADYMTARSAQSALENNITRGLIRSNLPQLPPALGFEGDREYQQQVDIWKRWIQWEQEDNLVLKADEFDLYKQRVVYVYKHCMMALRFWPEMWVEAAEWCFANGLEKDGNEFLVQGIAANPESCLLAFKQADHLETVLPIKDGEDGLVSRGRAVREPYDKLLDALYDLIKKLKVRETQELAKIEEEALLDANIENVLASVGANDDDTNAASTEKELVKTQKIKTVQQGYAAQTQLLTRTISFAWIALTRAMRRVQGKGKLNAKVGGSRQILNDARLRGRITSDVYVASALIEHHVYKDPAGGKIFERGAKLFPEDEMFTLEYLKHLLSIGDTTNARALFQTVVQRLTQKSELVPKAKCLYLYFHKYESTYGELSQIQVLEQRMAELYPEDPKLQRFASRFTSDNFDPTAVRPIISPEKQMRPKIAVMDSIEQPPLIQDSPRPQFSREDKSPRPSFFQAIQATHSPKRPFPPGDESDGELNRPRKLARGESPLKGAAGRRLEQQQKRLQQQGGGYGAGLHQQQQPASVPPMVSFLLSIMPRSNLFDSYIVNPEGLVRILARTQIPDPDTYDGQQMQRQSMQYNNNTNGMNGATFNQNSSFSSVNPLLGTLTSQTNRGVWNPASQPSNQPITPEQAAQWLYINTAAMMAASSLQPQRVQDLVAEEPPRQSRQPRQTRQFYPTKKHQYRRY